MNRPTLAIIRNAELPQILGECSANLAAIRSIVNRAQRRLIYDPLAPDDGWWGGYAEMVFTATVDAYGQAYLTTPRDVARLAGMTICGCPARMRNRFYEYMVFGNGLKTGQRCWRNLSSQIEAIERDTVPTLTDLVGTKQLRFYLSDPGDVGLKITAQGLDANSKPILDADVLTGRAIFGEKIELQYPFNTSVNTFSKITGLMKPNTLGQITIVQVDTDGNESDLSVMEPGETTAAYRRYVLTGLPRLCCSGTNGQVTVSAMAKLDLVPAMSDSDALLIWNTEALIEECQAVLYSSMDSPNASNKMAEHHRWAIGLLFGELDHYLGKANTAISCPIFGSDRLTPQII